MNIQDRRRLLGPSNAKPIVFSNYSESTQKLESKSLPEVGSTYIKTGLVKNCNGSSYVEVVMADGSKFMIITSVYGPKPIRGSFVAKAAVSVHISTNQGEVASDLSNIESIEGFDSTEENIKDLNGYLKNCFDSTIQLEKYPKSGIDIFVNVVSSSSLKISNPFFLKHSINGILLSLINANIEVNDLIGCGISNDRCITTFIKNGQEIVGFWKLDEDENDEGESGSAEESITKCIELCKEDYLQNKQLIRQFLQQD